ncbi:hypothetical protein EIP86_003086 [Pleurotus ostreatoroseus]|nr:hypothetical protein EIP86_003086 [Pleurotus ostreatoroseus]
MLQRCVDDRIADRLSLLDSSEIAELMAVKAKYSGGGEYAPSWMPNAEPPPPALPAPPPPPAELEPPAPAAPAWRTVHKRPTRREKKEPKALPAPPAAPAIEAPPPPNMPAWAQWRRKPKLAICRLWQDVN